MICLIDLVVMYVLSMVWVFFMVGWMSLFFFFGVWVGNGLVMWIMYFIFFIVL